MNQDRKVIETNGEANTETEGVSKDKQERISKGESEENAFVRETTISPIRIKDEL